MHLQDVALLNSSVLQPAGFLLEAHGSAADGQAGDHFLWDTQRTLTPLHRMHLLLEGLHLAQQALKTQGGQGGGGCESGF